MTLNMRVNYGGMEYDCSLKDYGDTVVVYVDGLSLTYREDSKAFIDAFRDIDGKIRGEMKLRLFAFVIDSLLETQEEDLLAADDKE